MEKTNRNSLLNRSVPLLLMLLILLGACTLTFAGTLCIFHLPLNKLSVWTGHEQESAFTVSNVERKISGPKKITITLELTNTDVSEPHSANVTLQLLDEAEDVIIEASALTGEIEKKGTWTHKFVFQQDGLVAQYTGFCVVIDQLDA